MASSVRKTSKRSSRSKKVVAKKKKTVSAWKGFWKKYCSIS
jgi:hypothetical protein